MSKTAKDALHSSPGTLFSEGSLILDSVHFKFNYTCPVGLSGIESLTRKGISLGVALKGYPQLPGQWLQGRWPSRRQRRNLERNLNFRENSEDRKRRERSRPRGEDAGCKKNSLRRKEGGERKRSWGEVGRACQEKQQEKDSGRV